MRWSFARRSCCAWPGRTKPGRYNDLVTTVDLVPTMLTAGNVKVPQRMLGLNLLDVAQGKGQLKRTAVFGEIYRHTATEAGQPRLDVLWRWMRTGDWKLILPSDPKAEVELYDWPRIRTNGTTWPAKT